MVTVHTGYDVRTGEHRSPVRKGEVGLFTVWAAFDGPRVAGNFYGVVVRNAKGVYVLSEVLRINQHAYQNLLGKPVFEGASPKHLQDLQEYLAERTQCDRACACEVETWRRGWEDE